MKSKKKKILESKFSFKAKLWKYEGPRGWCFVTVPKVTAKQIRKIFGESEQGWGRLKTTAKTGTTIWETAVWYDTKADSYLLPVKTSIRKKAALVIGTVITIGLEFNTDF
jgi:hypothetical protein